LGAGGRFGIGSAKAGAIVRIVTIVVRSKRKRSFIFMGYSDKPDPPNPLGKGGQEEEEEEEK
jgi:hypothetical protein